MPTPPDKRRSTGKRPPRPKGEAEPPPWKRHETAAEKGRKAGWGGVARRGAGQVKSDATGASAAFRSATTRDTDWEPEIWIDEGDVRKEADQAVGRGRRRPHVEAVEDDPKPDPSLRRAVPARTADKMEATLKEASKAFRRERFEEARKLLRPLAEAAPTAESVRELLGLTYYRLGRWKQAITELEAFRGLNGSTEQHPVLEDCYRALGRHAKVTELWEELKAVSPSAALVAEGRIVYAGSLADQGRLDEAIAVLEASPSPGKKPREHHVRVTYALADLHERAGDLPKARQLFTIVVAVDPELGDAARRLAALR